MYAIPQYNIVNILVDILQCAMLQTFSNQKSKFVFLKELCLEIPRCFDIKIKLKIKRRTDFHAIKNSTGQHEVTNHGGDQH
jgi:hypothetical protein